MIYPAHEAHPWLPEPLLRQLAFVSPQVFYSADLKMRMRVPKLILNILTTTALKSAVSWVKRESEADWASQSSAGLPKFSFGGFGKKTEAEPLPVPVESGFPSKYKVSHLRIKCLAEERSPSNT